MASKFFAELEKQSNNNNKKHNNEDKKPRVFKHQKRELEIVTRVLYACEKKTHVSLVKYICGQTGR